MQAEPYSTQEYAMDTSNRQRPSASLPFSMTKRIIDIILASVLLLVSTPFLLLITLIIKLESPGTFLIKQERVGWKGKKFIIYKFRTMYANSPLYSQSPKEPTDNRVTPFGKFLRQSSLDELPQVFNILKGNMSMVGPRPEMPFIVEKYEEWQRKRLDVKPGLTGLWQISGRKDRPLLENIEIDIYYINHQSLWFDLIIILKTIPVVIIKKGAY